MGWIPFKKTNDNGEETGVGLTPPWISHARKIYALFAKDPDIDIVYDPDEPEIKLYVAKTAKAEAIASILPVEEEFGNIKLKITVVMPNEVVSTDVLTAAFDGNPILSEIVSIDGATKPPMCYVVFSNEVVQYFNDDLSDANGVQSTLYEDIASDVLEPKEGVFYCTAVNESSKIVWPEE